MTLGQWLDWTTQQWVKVTGRHLHATNHPWLDGPVGRTYIGDTWLVPYAESVGAELRSGTAGGLVPSMAALDQPGFSAGRLHPLVADFYERTSEWRLDVWSRWSAGLRLPGVVLARLFARRLQQLNLPLDPMEVSRGMTSEVRHVVTRDGAHLGTAWQRTLRANNRTAFGGYYGLVRLPESVFPAIRVVFPLPNGSVTVLLRPQNTADGGLLLTSEGRSWGGTGAYLVVRGAGDDLWAKKVPLRERFDVFVDDEGVLRADHHLGFLRWPVLHLHYRMERPSSRRPHPSASN